MSLNFIELSQSLSLAEQKAQALYYQNRRPFQYFAHRVQLIENALHTLWQHFFPQSDFALLALGGFGRGELYPHSDIDLALLTSQSPSDDSQETISAFVQTLWDLGLQPALKTGTIYELQASAADDLTADTAFLEARFLCGNENLAQTALNTWRNQRDIAAFTEGKILEMQQRHDKQSALPLEPDLKNGEGGLRDIHTMLWLAIAQGLPSGFGELRRLNILTHVETGLLRHAYYQLARFRIELHFAAKRPQEKLLFDFQAALAQARGLGLDNKQAGSEALMHELYRTLKTVRQLTAILVPMLRGRVYSPLPRIVCDIDEHYFQIGNRIAVHDLNLFQKNPEHIFILLEHLQTRHDLVGIAPKSLRAWWVASQQINQSFYENNENRRRFLGFFQRGEGLTHIMRWLNVYGILARYLPEWHKIVGLLQHDLFHIYPVDDHILTVLRNIRRFAIKAHSHELPLASALMQRFDQPYILYLAALFHDIAKGRNGAHEKLAIADVRRFATDHKLPENDAQLLEWLVEQHLLMSAVAQKEDIADPEVVARFCTQVQTQKRLDALYLLTTADIRGTNPKLWTSWKAQLLSRLYQNATARLAGKSDTRDTLLMRRQQDAAETLKQHGFEAKHLRRLQNLLGEAYFVRHDSDEICWHIPFLAKNPENAQCQMRTLHDGTALQVMVKMPNGERLFTRLCRIFSHHGLDITSARAFITESNDILDTFILHFPEHSLQEDQHRIQQNLADELNAFLQGHFHIRSSSGKTSRRARHLPIMPYLALNAAPENLNWYNLSIIAANRSHLLADITEVFAQHNISLSHANITTQIDRVEDSFLIFAPTLADPVKALKFKQDLQKVLNG